MNRRNFLAASTSGIFVGLSGCLDPLQAATDTTKNETEHCVRSLVLMDVFPREIERDFIDGEYVRLENIATEPVDVTDYVIEYDEGTEFSLPKITMEPGSMMALISRRGEDTTLQSSPPAYLVYASFDDNLETSVMNESGTVNLRAPDETLVDTIRYSEQPE